MSTDPVPPAESLVHVVSHAGHHAAYQQFLGRTLALAPASGPLDRAMVRRLVRAERLLFATLDDDVFGFVRTALSRSLRGRPTAGLFLHATSCFEPGAKGRIKRALFAALKRLPGVSVISILPFERFPRTRAVASAAIADPQLWDQLDEPDDVDADFVSALAGLAAGRPILAYSGWATPEKDFDFLSRILSADPAFARDICVVAGGRVADPCRAAAERFCANGGILFDRFVTDAEMAALYQVADMMWVCYAPGYDQASGIFGRAVQRGTPVAIRATSTTIAYFCDLLAHPHVRLPEDAAAAAQMLRQRLLAREGGGAAETPAPFDERQLLSRWRDDALAILRAALSGSESSAAATGDPAVARTVAA